MMNAVLASIVGSTKLLSCNSPHPYRATYYNRTRSKEFARDTLVTRDALAVLPPRLASRRLRGVNLLDPRRGEELTLTRGGTYL